jgi:hypothetical protein
MSDTARSSWPHRFLEALPSWRERALRLLVLVLTFGAGVYIGVMLSITWEVQRHARASERRIAEAIAQLPSRPTLHQRLDAIEQRLQAIEHRLTP